MAWECPKQPSPSTNFSENWGSSGLETWPPPEVLSGVPSEPRPARLPFGFPISGSAVRGVGTEYINRRPNRGNTEIVCETQGLAKLSDLWETVTMTQPELTDVGWLGPRDEMDRASHRLGKCSECHEIICVEKAVTDRQNTQPETNEMLYKAFRTHVKLKHSEDSSQAATRIVRETTEN